VRVRLGTVRKEGGDSAGESEACDGPQGGSDGWDEPQRERDELMGDPTAEPTGPIDQFCSSCNHKKPLIDFGWFLTCNACRQRNRKASRARHIKQKALLNNESSSS
jgi:hypothetical protein